MPPISIIIERFVECVSLKKKQKYEWVGASAMEFWPGLFMKICETIMVFFSGWCLLLGCVCGRSEQLMILECKIFISEDKKHNKCTT